jgi:AcrR family transcriptional regulator
MSTRGVGRPAGADVDATRASIVAAARNRFALLGYAGTSNRDVAAAAGVTHGTVYHYFKTKRALFAAVVNDAYDAILPRFSTMELPESFAGRMDAISARIAELEETEGSLLRFLATVPLEQVRNPELLGIMGSSALSVHDLVGQLVDASVAAGDLAADLDRGATSAMLAGCLLGITLYSDVAGDVSFAGMLAALARVLRGDHLALTTSAP